MLAAVMAVLLAKGPPPASLDAAAAARFATLALDCVGREYPNKIAHVLSGEEDVRPPHVLTLDLGLASERIDTDLLFRWFLDMSIDEPSFARVCSLIPVPVSLTLSRA